MKSKQRVAILQDSKSTEVACLSNADSFFQQQLWLYHYLQKNNARIKVLPSF